MQIETERLILREFVSDDWLVMARYWRDPRYQHFYPENDDPAPSCASWSSASSRRRQPARV